MKKLILALALFCMPAMAAEEFTGPVIITVPAGTTAEDLLVFRDTTGQKVGAIRKDAQGRLAIAGPNYGSNTVTINSLDKVAIGTAPTGALPTRLYVDTDFQATGIVRAGSPDCYANFRNNGGILEASVPVDPNGTFQTCRISATGSNQVMSQIRMFRKNMSNSETEEYGRIGTDANGIMSVMKGDLDIPMWKFRKTGAVYFCNPATGANCSEWTYNNGTIKGQHPISGKVTDVIPY